MNSYIRRNDDDVTLAYSLLRPKISSSYRAYTTHMYNFNCITWLFVTIVCYSIINRPINYSIDLCLLFIFNYSMLIIAHYPYWFFCSLLPVLIFLQIEANYDSEEAKKCLYWIRAITGFESIPNDVSAINGSADNFYELLHDGTLLCQLVQAVNVFFNTRNAPNWYIFHWFHLILSNQLMRVDECG